MSVGRIIETPDCVAEGAQWLAGVEPRFAQVLPALSPLPLRRRPDGFAELLSAIVSQQLSVASASAVWGRMAEAGLVTPKAVIRAGEDGLRASGLSRQKIRYALALAGAEIDYSALRGAQYDDVVETLTRIPGIGRWTADIYAMFSLGRADVFAPGDLALQEAARMLFEMPARPGEGELRAMAEVWSPWRSVAARLLWAYYRQAKGREGITA